MLYNKTAVCYNTLTIAGRITPKGSFLDLFDALPAVASQVRQASHKLVGGIKCYDLLQGVFC